MKVRVLRRASGWHWWCPCCMGGDYETASLGRGWQSTYTWILGAALDHVRWHAERDRRERMRSMTLAEFLLARIDEDESDAANFAGTAYARWHVEPDPDPGRIGGRVVGLGKYAEVANDWSGPYNPAGYVGISSHIARWDPARVLAECDAKRRIVELVTDEQPLEEGHWEGHGSDERWIADRVPEVLMLLALPYADHPDYRDEWRP